MALGLLDRERLEDRFRYDTPFWAGGVTRGPGGWKYPSDREFQGVAKILNKSAKLVPAIAHPWQLELDSLLEDQRRSESPMRVIVLKARKLGFCGDPSTRVLTADMRWLTLEEILPGQRIVAVDEKIPGGKGKSRKLREGVVEAKREVYEPAFRILFDDGRELVATGQHRWLCKEVSGCAEWRTVNDMNPGDEVRHVTTPWDAPTVEDGWMGGMIDGEGSVRHKEAVICQRDGKVMDRARRYLADRGYHFGEQIETRDSTSKLARKSILHKLVVGRKNEVFRLIGQTRPTRFVDDTSWWKDRDLPGKRSGVAWAKVTAIEPLGPKRMIDLQTDRKTFIAEGFVSHNSTWIALKFLQRLTMMQYQHGIVVAQDVKTASQIFEMAKRAWVHLPEIEQLGLGFSIKPAIISEGNSVGRKFMQFGEQSKRIRQGGRTGNSMFEIDTAGSPESGRGYTPTMVHLSEVAWWEGNQATRKMLSMLNAVSYEPETIVVLESTANGLNHFHRRWISARDGQKDPETGESYRALFVPWWRDPACSAPFPNDEAKDRFLEGIGDESKYGEVATDEPMLQELYQCSPEQLFWRRRMIREQHESSVELFNQENPHSDEVAFIGSGRTVYSSILVARAIKAVEAAPTPVTGGLQTAGELERRTRAGTIKVPTSVRWVPDPKQGEPLLDVWEHPHLAAEAPTDAPSDLKQDGAYVVSVDVAEGEANTFTKGDYHVIQVFNHRTREQVAVHESRMDIHLLPLWVLQVALYYNEAWLAPEINGPGIVVVDTLRNDYHYPKLIKRSRYGALREGEQQKPGWKTDAQSKPIMEATFGQALQDDLHGLRDLRTARQLSTYVITERGKHEAQAGEHDDRLIAAMIAHEIMEMYRPPGEKKKRRRFTPTDPLVGY